jgi:alkylation response protein AidB-like acyl-CoA dehydrogenase
MADTAAQPTAPNESDVLVELKGWLEDNWDPDLTVAEWWERLGDAGWAAPTWPVEWFGKGLSRSEAVQVQKMIAEFGALPAPGGLGLMLAGPTIVDHGTDEQKDRFLRDIVTGQRGWCQLFSEPGAGSDLAGLQARAERDGDEWIVNGQKVWTSGGQAADLGMLIARTDPDVPKHRGITYFGIDMHQDGVEVRPLKEMTGRALFNEVFLTDARVADADCIGDHGDGWRVANTTLMHERSSLGAGGGSESASVAMPGQVRGDLGRRVGDFVDQEGTDGTSGVTRGGSMLVTIAGASGRTDDPTVRQDLMKLHTMNEVAKYNGLRVKAARKAGRDLPGMANIAKLSMSRILRASRDLGLELLGPRATLHPYNAADQKVLAENTSDGGTATGMTEYALFSPGPSIYGGTDEIQKNIIGERVLGLPKEPNQDKVLPFKELPKNG